MGDNDHLAASAAQMVDADVLLIITSAMGLYDKDPKQKGAKLIKSVKYGQCLTEIDMSTKTDVRRGGVDDKQAHLSVTQLFMGSAALMKDQSDLTLQQLIDQVTSKGGVTIEAVNSDRQDNLDRLTSEALNQAYRRSQEMSLT